MIDIINFIFETIDLIASVFGFLALYGIAIALLDIRKIRKYEQEFKQLKDD